MLRLFISVVAILLACFSSSLAIAGPYDCARLLTRPDGKRIPLLWSQPQGTQGQLDTLCLTRIPMTKQKYFDGTVVNGVWTVTPAAVAETVKPLIGEPQHVINIEAWSLAPSLPEATRLANIAKYAEVIKVAVATTPKSKVGIYGVAPYRNWFSAISGDPERLAQMQDWNDQLQPVATRSTALYPSLYVPVKSTQKPTLGQYRLYVTVNLTEARRLAGAKPVYPVIWNRYSDNIEVSADYFAEMLRANHGHSFSNAVVIWISSKEPWATSSSWYRGLVKFLNQRAAEVAASG
jgi:hypothetical protein